MQRPSVNRWLYDRNLTRHERRGGRFKMDGRSAAVPNEAIHFAMNIGTRIIGGVVRYC